jgi:hypothetical protein
MFIKTDTCAIMQPTYLPWLGYFDLIANSRDFIFLDDVKFNKSSYHHQNKILGANGTISLSVPTRAHKGRTDTLINEVEIDDSRRWRKKHLSSIQQSYGKAPYYGEIYPHIENILYSNITNLSELNIKLIKLFSSMLLLDSNFHVASRMEGKAQDKVQRLIEFCQMQECTSYYSPIGSLDYLDSYKNKELFNNANISIYFQQFKLAPYFQKQVIFTPYMSIIDALMYCGSENVRVILKDSCCISKLK